MASQLADSDAFPKEPFFGASTRFRVEARLNDEHRLVYGWVDSFDEADAHRKIIQSEYPDAIVCRQLVTVEENYIFEVIDEIQSDIFGDLMPEVDNE